MHLGGTFAKFSYYTVYFLLIITSVAYRHSVPPPLGAGHSDMVLYRIYVYVYGKVQGNNRLTQVLLEGPPFNRRVHFLLTTFMVNKDVYIIVEFGLYSLLWRSDTK